MASRPRYKALLLDMNGTFMFGHDRFGPTEDFFSTYLAMGSGCLSPDEVKQAVLSVYRRMSADYSNPGRVDDFPSVAESFARHARVPEDEAVLLERVFAAHERGRVPEPFANCVRRLAARHAIGVVSNIWARKEIWLSHFEEIGIAGVWRTMVFSSDTRSIKPSPVLFRRAIDDLGVNPGDILFVGDSLRADIEPAKALGMNTAWVGAAATLHASAVWTAPSLLELEQMLH